MFRRRRGVGRTIHPASGWEASGPVATVVASWPEQPGSRFPTRAARRRARTDGPSAAIRSGVLSREEAVRRLTVVECQDDETARHVDQMSRYCALLAVRAGLGAERAELIRKASRLHDIGKICIPRHILLKPERLTDEEFQIVQRHAEIGHSILAGTRVDWMELGAVVALTHHEHYDGGGYPHRLAGSQIPFVGRIAAIADVFDALTSRRPYKSALSTQSAVDIMLEGRGRQFDPWALDLFLRSLDEIVSIQDESPDLLVSSPRGTLVACGG
jgi:cyclic di-GMP phosphodiesterase